MLLRINWDNVWEPLLPFASYECHLVVRKSFQFYPGCGGGCDMALRQAQGCHSWPAGRPHGSCGGTPGCRTLWSAHWARWSSPPASLRLVRRAALKTHWLGLGRWAGATSLWRFALLESWNQSPAWPWALTTTEYAIRACLLWLVTHTLFISEPQPQHSVKLHSKTHPRRQPSL